MNAYIEISLLPDPEFPPTTLMSALFSKLHRGLAQHGGQCIGVSFPDIGERSKSLGQRLRLHGTAPSLDALMRIDWLKGMHDHLSVSAISEVPAGSRQRTVRRVQAHSNPERERRRLICRKGINAETARRLVPDSQAERLDLPYVVIASKSTDQKFRLFIEHLPAQDESILGCFSSYGLSPTATVPWF